ncbi:hypothetical protein ABTN40_19505, partial [Acinetobacter baumannii]
RAPPVRRTQAGAAIARCCADKRDNVFPNDATAFRNKDTSSLFSSPSNLARPFGVEQALDAEVCAVRLA